MSRLTSRFPGFGEMSRALDYSGQPPPPWVQGTDPRSTACRHDWPSGWGRIGERQHRCLSCDRWIWERSIWPAEDQQ